MNDNIIYYNIDESDYYVEYNTYKFYFSSQFYKDKFKDKIEKFIEEENYKLQSRFNLDLDFKDMLVFHLYQKIEKRGFKVEFLNNKKWANIEYFKFVSQIVVT